MLAQALINELSNTLGQDLPPERIALFVRLGRAHGYPDCCIRAFAVTFSQSSGVPAKPRTDEEAFFDAVAKRRVCDECLAKMKEVSLDGDGRREQRVEILMSHVRAALNALYNARKHQSGNTAAEEQAWNEIRVAVNNFVDVRIGKRN